MYDNMRHAHSNGLIKPKGRPKLSKEDVLKIRHEMKNGGNKKELSKLFNVGVETIMNIHRGETWKYL
jgi:hypothetical protein